MMLKFIVPGEKVIHFENLSFIISYLCIIPEPTFTIQILPILTNHKPLTPLSETLEPLI